MDSSQPRDKLSVPLVRDFLGNVIWSHQIHPEYWWQILVREKWISIFTSLPQISGLNAAACAPTFLCWCLDPAFFLFPMSIEDKCLSRRPVGLQDQFRNAEASRTMDWEGTRFSASPEWSQLLSDYPDGIMEADNKALSCAFILLFQFFSWIFIHTDTYIQILLTTVLSSHNSKLLFSIKVKGI